MVAVCPSPSAARDLLAGLLRKQQAVAALIDGKVSLLEAAARFRDGGTKTDGEGLCRSVIGWVHLALSERPEKAEAVSLRLEGELQAYVDRSGRGALALRARLSYDAPARGADGETDVARDPDDRVVVEHDFQDR